MLEGESKLAHVLRPAAIHIASITAQELMRRMLCRIHSGHYNMGGDKYDLEAAEYNQKLTAYKAGGGGHGEKH